MIEIAHIQKRLGKKQVLKDISFHVDCGQCVAIVGKNGCGKSTLLQIMAGVLKADHGEIHYFGKDAGKDKKIIRQYCGYVPQDNPLMEELSVRDNLKLWAGSNKDMQEKVIEQFELEGIMKQQVSKLSGGMKRRLSIACAMQQWPPVLLLDEPTSALDIYYKKSILQWIRQYQKMNGMVVMTTHDEMEILSADRCLVMEDGNIHELTGDEIQMERIWEYITH